MAKKNGKEKAVTGAKQRERKEHPFGPPEDRAKGFNVPSPNPLLFADDKSTASLPQNLQDVVAAIAKHSGGVPLKSLEDAKLSAKTLAWLVRQLCKHGFVKAVAEERPETARKATKAAAK